jgi:Protein of unknown function (DUF551)
MPRIELTDLERQKLAKAGADSIRRNNMEWQSIETAPTDGTPFIGAQILSDSKLATMAVVRKSPKLPDKIWQCCASVMVFNSHTDGQGVHVALPFLTHWMPLPEPPK